MIRTDGRPTIAWAPSLPEVINDGRDPGDEHYDRPQRTRPWTVSGTDSGNGTYGKEEDA